MLVYQRVPKGKHFTYLEDPGMFTGSTASLYLLKCVGEGWAYPSPTFLQ